jgi:hypothetical protein
MCLLQPYELLSGVFSTVGAALLYTLDTPAKRGILALRSSSVLD